MIVDVPLVFEVLCEELTLVVPDGATKTVLQIVFEPQARLLQVQTTLLKRFSPKNKSFFERIHADTFFRSACRASFCYFHCIIGYSLRRH